MKDFIIYENKVLKETITNYKPLTNHPPIGVKVNGIEVEARILGSEDDLTVVFTNPVREGSLLTVAFKTQAKKALTRRLVPMQELYPLYTSELTLATNTTYDYILHLKGEVFSKKYRTKYDPYYTTIKTIRNDTGSLLKSIKDDGIDKLIHENSLVVEDLLGDRLEGEFTVDGKVTLPVSNYVRYKTDIDIVNAIYLSMCGRYGKFDKMLGTLEVSNDYKLPELEDMLARFKELLKLYEDAFKGPDTPLSFRKSSSNEYTVIQRGIF